MKEDEGNGSGEIEDNLGDKLIPDPLRSARQTRTGDATPTPHKIRLVGGGIEEFGTKVLLENSGDLILREENRKRHLGGDLRQQIKVDGRRFDGLLRKKRPEASEEGRKGFLWFLVRQDQERKHRLKERMNEERDLPWR